MWVDKKVLFTFSWGYKTGPNYKGSRRSKLHFFVAEDDESLVKVQKWWKKEDILQRVTSRLLCNYVNEANRQRKFSLDDYRMYNNIEDGVNAEIKNKVSHVIDGCWWRKKKYICAGCYRKAMQMIENEEVDP